MANYSELLFATAFVLLSIFAIYNPWPLVSFFGANGIKLGQAPCAEGEYYESGISQCRPCDIPCQTSDEKCREYGCSDYYNKIKDKQCKPDQYFESAIGACQPCTIPCSMSAEKCLEMACAVNSSLITPAVTVSLPVTGSPDDEDSLTIPVQIIVAISGIIAILGAMVGLACCCFKPCMIWWLGSRAEERVTPRQKWMMHKIRYCSITTWDEIIASSNEIRQKRVTQAPVRQVSDELVHLAPTSDNASPEVDPGNGTQYPDMPESTEDAGSNLLSRRGFTADCSSSRMPVNEVQSELNAKLAIHVHNKLGIDQFKNLKLYLMGDHGISSVRDVENADTVRELIDLLISDKKIQVGKPDGYNLLTKGLVYINKSDLADDVKKYQEKIVKAGTSKPDAATSSSTTQPGLLEGD